MSSTVKKELMMEWVPCLAHTLSLALKAAFDEVVLIAVVFSLISSLAGYLHRSTTAANQLKTLQQEKGLKIKKCPQYTEIRWCSSLTLIKFMIDNKPALLALNPPAKKKKKTSTRKNSSSQGGGGGGDDEEQPTRLPTSEDFDFLGAIHALVVPVEKLVKILDLENNTLGLIKPMISFMKEEMRGLAEGHKNKAIKEAEKVFTRTLTAKFQQNK